MQTTLLEFTIATECGMTSNWVNPSLLEFIVGWCRPLLELIFCLSECFVHGEYLLETFLQAHPVKHSPDSQAISAAANYVDRHLVCNESTLKFACWPRCGRSFLLGLACILALSPGTGNDSIGLSLQ